MKRLNLEKLKHHAPTLALIGGFLFDALTLSRPDRLFDNIVMLGYLTIAGGIILILNWRRHRNRAIPDYEERLPLLTLIQFCFGNLASSLLILYSKSGSLEGNLIFFALLAGFLIGNEYLRSRYAHFFFHLGAYYVLVLSYLVLVVPVLVGQIGWLSFIAAGALSITFMTGFMSLMYLLARQGVYVTNGVIPPAKQVFTSILGILVFFNVLYGLNIIPPVPLSLTSIGVYHSIEKRGSGYFVSYEKPKFWEFWRTTSGTFTGMKGSSAYCFSAVFAPAGLDAPIYHHFEYLDDGKWVSLGRVPFTLSGGRDEGYRGYSVTSHLAEGQFRCSVETERGGVIGRENFKVVEDTTQLKLTTQTL